MLLLLQSQFKLTYVILYTNFIYIPLFRFPGWFAISARAIRVRLVLVFGRNETLTKSRLDVQCICLFFVCLFLFRCVFRKREEKTNITTYTKTYACTHPVFRFFVPFFKNFESFYVRFNKLVGLKVGFPSSKVM